MKDMTPFHIAALKKVEKEAQEIVNSGGDSSMFDAIEELCKRHNLTMGEAEWLRARAQARKLLEQ